MATKNVKKVVKKSTPVKTKKVVKSVTPVVKPIKTSFNKTTLTQFIVDQTGVERKQVVAVLAALNSAIERSVMNKGNESFMYPGYFKITRVVKKYPARKGGVKAINPFTKEEYITTARKAFSKVVLKVRPLAKLKSAAQ